MRDNEDVEKKTDMRRDNEDAEKKTDMRIVVTQL